MTKWFVRTAEVREIVEADTREEAMIKAIKRNPRTPLGLLIGAYEIKGRETQEELDDNPKMWLTWTSDLLKEMGVRFFINKSEK